MPLAAVGAWRALAHAMWHGRSVRTQLLMVFVLLDLVAGLIGGAVTILQARAATRVEIAASLDFARLMVSEAVSLIQQELPAEKFLTDLASQLPLVRHVRIAVRGAADARLASQPSKGIAESARNERVPAWFAALIAPPAGSQEVPVLVNAERIGAVEIVAEPRDEIAEVWNNVVSLGLVAIVLNIALIILLYISFGRVLDPLAGLTRGLAELERRNYRVRLPRPQAQELAAITERFNALAGALDGARAENAKLSQRLITAQDDERRRTALDLHDEVGPSLFGLKANASSIAAAADALPAAARRKIGERLRDMLATIEHLQAINRSMLNRLRPMALGQVPLREVISELVQERARQQRQIEFTFSAGELLRGYDDSIDLTIYRCVQEALTNAMRHARAKHVVVELAERKLCEPDENGAAQLQLSVCDDGRGMNASACAGFGIRGMQERVQALGGSCAIESRQGQGTCVRILIPLG